MKFLYEYRTSDNAKHNGVIRAADREAAYALLKKQGIKPSRFSEAPGVFNKLFGKGKRWIAIGVLGAACVVLTVIIRSPPATPPAATSLPRHQIYGDSAWVEMCEATGYANVFSGAGERLLARFAQPGVAARPPRSFDPGELVAALDRRCEVLPTDTREVRELKLVVEGMKDELRDYLADGVGTPATYVERLKERQAEECAIVERVRRELETESNGYVRSMKNEELRMRGLPTIPEGKKFSKAR